MKLAVGLILLVIIVFLSLRFAENKMIFLPSKYPNGVWRPDLYDVDVENCSFESADGVKLHGWFASNPAAKQTMLWCHGNAGNISDRLQNLARFAELPVNVFIFDYRGYGKSQGKPDEKGVYLDAEAAYDFLVRDKGVEPQNIVLFGRSLGGAIAVELASKRTCGKLIVESTFTSISDMAKIMFGSFSLNWLFKSRFDSASKIGQLRVPVLILHGNKDQIVPFALGKKLFEAASKPKTFFAIEGADHNDTWFVGGKLYLEQFHTFLTEGK